MGYKRKMYITSILLPYSQVFFLGFFTYFFTSNVRYLNCSRLMVNWENNLFKEIFKSIKVKS